MIEETYKTKNFYLSAYLIAQRFELLQIDKTTKRMDFIFASSDELVEAATRFYNQGNIVDTQSFILAIKQLKSKMYD